MGIEKGRKKLFRKMKRQMKRQGNYNASQLAMRYKSALSADPGNTMSNKGYDLRTQVGPGGSMANERELARQADAGERVISDNMEAAAKAALKGTSMLVGGVPGAVINASLSGMDAAQSGEDGGMAFAKSIGKSALNMYGGQLLEKGEQAFLANRAMKEGDRLSLAEMNYDDGKIDAGKLARRQERFDIAQDKANQGTTALGDITRKLNKTGLFNNLLQSNNIAQNHLGVDPNATALAAPSGPEYDFFTPDSFNE